MVRLRPAFTSDTLSWSRPMCILANERILTRPWFFQKAPGHYVLVIASQNVRASDPSLFFEIGYRRKTLVNIGTGRFGSSHFHLRPPVLKKLFLLQRHVRSQLIKIQWFFFVQTRHTQVMNFLDFFSKLFHWKYSSNVSTTPNAAFDMTRQCALF